MGQSQSTHDHPPPSHHPQEHGKEGAPSDRRQSQPTVLSARNKPLGARQVPTPPTASLVSSPASAHASISALHATVNNSPRHRNSNSSMGAAESKPRPPSRGNTLPSPPSASTSATTSPTEKSTSSPQEIPIAAQHAVSSVSTRDAYMMSPPYGLPPPNFSRPPRLPLPIEEELHVPGSPIISPQDISSPLDADDVETSGLPRPASVTSSAVDEDDEGDDAFLPDHAVDGVKIPYTFEWHSFGEQVFVTGTFVNWERKLKLHRNTESKAKFSATVLLPPGTHHLKFLVDGDMYTSSELPTTVDWGNNLVNYIEIEPQAPGAKQPPVPSEPMPIPGAAVKTGTSVSTDGSAAKPLSDGRTNLPSDSPDITGRVGTDNLASDAPRAPSTPDRQPHAKPQPSSPPIPVVKVIPRAKYTNEIPQFLIDIDLPREDERFLRASRVVDHLPRPPSLPQFLNKSILNGVTPLKDDASVLVMPNHTVLNHLATSSIKHGVLPSSGTTRYRRKFLTTIYYKPSARDG